MTLPTAFDVYETIRVIGEGGNGRVYEARDSAGRTVAVKLLKHGLSEAKRKRFKNEITFCERSTHKNIVSIIDTGVLRVGAELCSFYVMPYYAKTLRTLIREGIRVDDVLPFFSQLLDGIEAAHLMGVCHRDLKPENVLYDPEQRTCVVADFGAAEFSEDDLYTLVETRPGERIANFQYAAPEQRTPGRSVDQRADIYALGLMLNEMYTGQVPTGTNHALIASVSSAHSYLDALVEVMRRQSPNDRPKTVDHVKREIIARGNEFVSLQKLNELRNAVVAANTPASPEPIRVIGIDIIEGDLAFKLSARPSLQWISLFTNPRHGYSSVMGRGPQTVTFSNGDTARIFARPHEADSVTRFFLDWVDQTNRVLPEVLAEAAEREARQERERIQRAFEDEQRRLELLRRAQSALR